MPRLPVRDELSAPPKTVEIFRYVREKYGALLDPIAITAHNEEILRATCAFEVSMNRANALSKRLKELAILKVATELGCPFCLDIGAMEADQAGVSIEQLAALRSFREAKVFDSDEQLVLEYALAMTVLPVQVSDDLFGRLLARFDNAAIVELTSAVAWENYRSRYNIALGMQSQGLSTSKGCLLAGQT